MKSLPIFVNLAGRSVLVLGHGPAAQAKARLVENSGGSVVSQIEAADDPPSNPPNNSPNNPPSNPPSNPQTYQGIRLAFIALDDEAAILEAVHRLRAKRVLVNVVDRGELCDFTTPAIIDRAPVILAIGTSGKSAGLAKALRQRLETILPATLGPLAEALAGARHAIRKRWSTATTRRRAIDAALAPGATLDPLREHLAAAAKVTRWLQTPETKMPETLHSATFEDIMLCSPSPDELTLRQARLLGQADRIFHTPEVPTAILRRARADAQQRCCPVRPAHFPPGLSLWVSYPAASAAPATPSAAETAEDETAEDNESPAESPTGSE